MEEIADELRHCPPTGSVREIDAAVLDVQFAPIGLYAHDALRT
jgi:hypothetical protein